MNESFVTQEAVEHEVEGTEHEVYLEKVITVLEDHPAEKAGLRVGDLITDINGVPVTRELFGKHVMTEGVPENLDIIRAGRKKRIVILPAWDEERKKAICGLTVKSQNFVTRIMQGKSGKKETFARDRVDFFDDQDKPLCGVIVDYAPKERVLIEPGSGAEAYPGRLVRNIYLEHPESKKRFDVLDRFNIHKAQVVVDWYAQRGYAKHSKDLLVIPEIVNQLSFRVLFHELRHIEQHHDERFIAIGKWYNDYEGMTIDAESKLWRYNIGGRIRDIQTMIENADRGIETELSELTQLMKEDALTGCRSTYPKDQDMRKARLMEINRRMLEILQLPQIRQFFALATQVVERDADYGALRALRLIRDETGINLLLPFKPKYRTMTKDEPGFKHRLDYLQENDNKINQFTKVHGAELLAKNRVNEAGEEIDDVHAHIDDTLETLCAVPAYMRRRQDKDDVGKMPRIRLDATLF